MKTITLTALFILVYFGITAQSDKFTQAMLSNLKKGDEAKTVNEMMDLANTFERIALSEKTQWTPWYYSALFTISASVAETDTDKKKKMIEQAHKMVDEGLKLKADETELMVLKVTSYFLEMSVDQMRAMELMPKAYALLEEARAINPENPRIYLTQAEAIYNMPAEYGGGKSKTLPIIQTAKDKFDKYVTENQISPNWGKERCEEIIAACQSAN